MCRLARFAAVLRLTTVVALAGATSPALAAPTWTTVGSMASAREAHAATLLPDGRVLVATGFANGGFLAGAEVYDPATQSWSPAGALSSGARALPSALLLQTGGVLVAGGTSSGSRGGNLSSAELFDPAAPGWTVAASLPSGRYRSIAVRLRTGAVLVAGGAGFEGLAVRSADLYDPVAGTWVPAAPMLGNRDQHTITVLASGEVLAAGGLGDGLGPAVERYDATTGTWSATGPMLTPRAFHAAALLPSGQVLVAGGFDGTASTVSAELYDPATGTWSPGPAMATPRYAHTATLLPSGRLLVAGGDGPGDVDVASAEEFDEGPAVPVPAPALDATPSAVAVGGVLQLQGSGFIGPSEGSGGNVQASASSAPLVQLQAQGGGTGSYAAVTSFGATALAAAVPADLPPGAYSVRVVASGVQSAASPLELQPALLVTPASSHVLTGGALVFSAAGGSGGGYGFSLAVNASGASIDPSTGAYTAGPAAPAGGVTDVVQVADLSGNTVTASVLVVPPVAITPATASVAAGGGQYFAATGGTGTGYTWSLTTSGSGGSIGPQSGAYAAGPAAGLDVVRVSDSLGFSATATVTVTAAPSRPGDVGCGCVAGGSGASLVPLLAFLLPGRRRVRRARSTHAPR